MKKFLFFIFVLFGICGYSQTDSLKFKNTNIVVGEVKSLINGVITMKTSFSDKDFKIEFKEVEEIYLNQTFLINLANGGHYLGKVRSIKPGTILIADEKGYSFETDIKSLTQLKASGTKIWDRFKGRIDLGFNLTKSNNFSQFTVSSDLKYVGELWSFNAGYSSLLTNQDQSDEIKRVDWNLDTQRFLFKDYYGIVQVSFLSNTEQALKGRTTGLLGIGRYLISSNRLYLGIRTGLNYNVETYFDPTLDKTSAEVNFGSEFNMFEFGDLSLLTDFAAYYGLSESKRFRLDYNLVFKYDLPWDFYIKTEFNLNYDNQPAAVGNEFDYILNSGFGWELK
tara:strand:+ start:19419 stop:20429 length:1011 start_codon:yes stop_codon:yes gene_type:complete